MSYPELPIPNAPIFNCDEGLEERNGSGATRQSEDISCRDVNSVCEAGGNVPSVHVGKMNNKMGGDAELLFAVISSSPS